MIVSVPTAKAEVVQVAVLVPPDPETGVVPQPVFALQVTDPPTSNLCTPPARRTIPVSEVTVAVKVTDWP